MRLPAFLPFALVILLVGAVWAQPPAVSIPRGQHPGQGQVFYFVLTDRFANGSTSNDTGGIPGGRDEHGFDPTVISHYHGGDFVGLTAHLDYIKNLGATAVWITPPFKNKPVQTGSASYHGYWITDFLQIDPHLGTDAEFREFVRQAHARGLKVFLDIIVNHTADVIHFEGGATQYRDVEYWPYRDAGGRPFDLRAVAANGLRAIEAFPALDPERSFAYRPRVTLEEAQVKNPAWLNELTLYHNRGNSHFVGASSLDGDFSGLDDLLTEHPRVVQGFIDIYRHWMEQYGVDGFRIDTARHVNTEFWHAFAPAIREHALQLGRPHFLAFGEVANSQGDVHYLSEFSTEATLDATLDFGFFVAARDYVSRRGSAMALAEFFGRDDLYTDHDSNVHATTTFLGNHDDGRFAYFLKQDNPDATDAQLVELMKLGHGLLFLVRGQPVIYYGDEQGMVGTGNDMRARESMFASRTPLFRALPLLGTSRTGADDKYDEEHPLYRCFGALARLRAAHPALAHGAMHVRPTTDSRVFAFSRIEREEQIEYVVALNPSRQDILAATLPTAQPPGAALAVVFDSRSRPIGSAGSTLTVDADGQVTVILDPLQYGVWRAEQVLPAAPAPAEPFSIDFLTPVDDALLAFSPRTIDGAVFGQRHELRAAVSGGDGVAEVTFVMTRSSRPGHYELLGVDDAPPYRVYWRPPPDLAPDETLTFIATADDLRGRRAVTAIDRVRVAPSGITFGVEGSTVPRWTQPPTATGSVKHGAALTLTATAEGTPPLAYEWSRNGRPVPGANAATLHVGSTTASDAGSYRLLVRNVAGTIVSDEIVVQVLP